MLVTRREILSGRLQGSKATDVHISFGIGAGYVRCMGVLITSIIMNNPSLGLEFHVFTDGIFDEDRQRLEQLVNAHAAHLNIYYLDADAFPELPVSDYLTKETCYRIIIPKFLWGTVKKILHLDADLICLGNISGLLDVDLTGFTLAAVPDVKKVAAEKIDQLQLHQKQYFNAGVLYIDVEKWNEKDISSLAMKIMMDSLGTHSLYDQDALNIALDGQVVFLGDQWNVVYDMGQMNHNIPSDTRFLHYTGMVKPWQKTGRHRLSNFYRDFEKQSFWHNASLLEPSGYKEMEIFARLSLKAGDFWVALFWYGKYIAEKIRRF